MKTTIYTVAFLTVMALGVDTPVLGQDIHFSQPGLSPQLLNPALTGAFLGSIRVITHYREQWRSIAKPYQTFAFSGDTKLFAEKWERGLMGAGIQIFNDRFGTTGVGQTLAVASLAYFSALNRHNYLSAGLQGGVVQHSIKVEALQWGNQYDEATPGFNPNSPSGETTTPGNDIYGDFNAGVAWQYFSESTTMTSNDGVRVKAGIAVFHSAKPQYSFYELNSDPLYRKIVAHADASIGIKNANIAALPEATLLFQGPSKEILVGLLVRYRLKEGSKITGFVQETAISLGGSYRLNDAFIPSVQFEFANFAFAVAYDVNVSGLNKASNGQGGLEIALRYINPNPFKYSTPRLERRSLL